MKLSRLNLRPILSAMRHNKVGALLISTQMAVTLAFIVNAFTVIEQRVEWVFRPTGVDEQRLFVVDLDSLSRHTDWDARSSADIEALRELPGVEDAYITNDYPFANNGWANSVNLQPDQKFQSATTSYYFGDTHTLKTLGLKLVGGRNFLPEEVVRMQIGKDEHVKVVIVSQALAHELFPGGSALGKQIYVEDNEHPVQIIGVVERLQGPFPAATGLTSTFIENSAIGPYDDRTGNGLYIVRTDPSRIGALTRAAEQRLLAIDPDRTVKAYSLTEAREQAHRGDVGLVVLLISICAALLLVTAFGIIGLTSYWVSQRRRQIGIRRALGATRHDIVQHFQTENLLMSMIGAGGGIALALALNIWMVRSFEMTRLESSRAVAGALIILLLGQLAVFWPALKASLVPPALAVRGG